MPYAEVRQLWRMPCSPVWRRECVSNCVRDAGVSFGVVEQNGVVVRDPMLPLVAWCLEQEVERGTALGATAHVRYRGEVVFEFACGHRDEDHLLTATDVVPWFSVSKIASSVAVARAWEVGLFDLDEPIASYISEFRGGAKDAITIRDLWTHTAPLLAVDSTVNTSMSWDEAIRRICAAEADRDAGIRVGYLGHSGMLLLGEVVARRSGTDFAGFFAREVAMPLGLRCRLGGPSVVSDLVDVPFVDTAATNIRFDAAAGFPGNCVIGPIDDAAALCQLLLDGGTFQGRAVLRPETVMALISPEHAGLMDQRLLMPVTTGLGFALDEFDFGRYCSKRSFGHGGARSSVAFADPDADLSVAIFFNGNCPLRGHVRRINAVSSAVYCDLGLADPADGGRDHQAPFGLVI